MINYFHVFKYMIFSSPVSSRFFTGLAPLFLMFRKRASGTANIAPFILTKLNIS